MVEKLKTESYEKDVRIDALEAKVAELGVVVESVRSAGSSISPARGSAGATASVLTTPAATPNVHGAALSPAQVATLEDEIASLNQEKLVLSEQLKLSRRTNGTRAEEYQAALRTHKELEQNLRREIELCGAERRADERVSEKSLKRLEKEFAKSVVQGKALEAEKVQISEDLSAAIVAMEKAQESQKARAAQLEDEIKRLQFAKESADRRMIGITQASKEHEHAVVTLQQNLESFIGENEELKALNEALQGKVHEASATIQRSNEEMARQRASMEEMGACLNKERARRDQAEKLLCAAEEEIRTLRNDLDGSHRTLGELRVLGEVLQVRTQEVEDRETTTRREMQERIDHLEKALESERQNRREWAQARVQLLQEFCQEEGRLRDAMGYTDNTALSPRARVLGMMAEKEQDEFSTAAAAAGNQVQQGSIHASPVKPGNAYIPGVNPYGTPPSTKSDKPRALVQNPNVLSALGRAQVDKGYF
jgi:DNA repair exonuclease SbcCD ATPase subunit